MSSWVDFRHSDYCHNLSSKPSLHSQPQMRRTPTVHHIKIFTLGLRPHPEEYKVKMKDETHEQVRKPFAKVEAASDCSAEPGPKPGSPGSNHLLVQAIHFGTDPPTSFPPLNLNFKPFPAFHLKFISFIIISKPHLNIYIICSYFISLQ